MGGAEVRISALVGPLRVLPRRAVPLNLLINLVMIVASFVIRGHTLR